MKNNIFFLIVITFLIIGFLVYDVHTKKVISERYMNQIEELQHSNAGLTYMLENVVVISKLQHYAEGRTLKNYTLHTVLGDTCKLKDLCNGRKLIYYFSGQGCQTCYLPVLNKLTDLSEKIGKENMIVIGMFKEKRAFKLFLQDLNPDVGFTIYQSEKEFDIYPDYNDYAQFFQLTNDLVINNICITDKSNVELSDNYLKLVENDFLPK